MKIIDKALEPFEIKGDNYGFTLVENSTATKKETGEKYETQYTVGHYSTIEGCIKEAAKLKAMYNLGEIATLNEFITAYTEIKNQIVDACKMA